MKKFGHIKAFAATAAMLLLSACASEIGGAGTLSTGEPVSGVIATTPPGKMPVTITSPAGWSCQGIWDESAGKGAAVTIPMTCSDGAKGTMILTMNNLRKEITGSFHLSNGKTGQVGFGFPSA